MRAIEFYMTPKGEVMLREEGKPEHQLKETDYDFISSFLNVIEEFYPDAYKKLMEEYARSEKRRTYRDFLAVRRFVKCNMGNYDSTLDLDENWNFKFEYVSCPLRGECTGQGVISPMLIACLFSFLSVAYSFPSNSRKMPGSFLYRIWVHKA